MNYSMPHKFLLAPMKGLAFSELSETSSVPIDTGEIRLPYGYEVIRTDHTLIYPRQVDENLTLELKFTIRKV